MCEATVALTNEIPLLRGVSLWYERVLDVCGVGMYDLIIRFTVYVCLVI